MTRQARRRRRLRRVMHHEIVRSGRQSPPRAPTNTSLPRQRRNTEASVNRGQSELRQLWAHRSSNTPVAVRRAAVVVAIHVAPVVLRDPAGGRSGVDGGRRGRRRLHRRRRWRSGRLGDGGRGSRRGRGGSRRRRRGCCRGRRALSAQPGGLGPRCLFVGAALRGFALRSAGRGTLRGPRMMHDRGDGRGRVSRRRAGGPATCQEHPEPDDDDQPARQRPGLINAVKRTFVHRLSPRTPPSSETFPRDSRRFRTSGRPRTTSAR